MTYWSITRGPYKYTCAFVLRLSTISRYSTQLHVGIVQAPKTYLTSKEIRKRFVDYFVEKKGHTYVHSSPVFLNSDPSLFFVNAGMNQFKNKLMNNLTPGHPFYNLQRVANSQKCIRITGKHSDLDNVGHDYHHHTFFEMLGSWSFGDYFKKEACEMAWELLTKVYGLPSHRLYVTYFGGDEALKLSPDIECRDIWLNIGVPKHHILPLGVKDNFWDMGDVGPCGPCTEIHYNNSLSSQDGTFPVGKDLVELWNLVFIQYRRMSNGSLEELPVQSVDTGMGLERLTAVLQGTTSNYNTDIFTPIFQAIKKNFDMKPYEGKLGVDDPHLIDTAYRIIADHARMFTVSISDGLFPDSCDAGHILRKVIRRAVYMANRVMKTQPGAFSSIVPAVAETLDFFPEVQSHTKEVIEIVNEEEKLYHLVINRGRKVRNKMLAEANNSRLEAKHVWELHYGHGLEENVIQDLAVEVKADIDWNKYKEFEEQKKMPQGVKLAVSEIDSVLSEIAQTLRETNVPYTLDSFKYDQCLKSKNVQDIDGHIVAIIVDGKIVHSAKLGEKCFLITDKTNFYSSGGGQISDIGLISSQDFSFYVDNVVSMSGYVFHEGRVADGTVISGKDATLAVEKDHRQKCACNHTATHLLNSALRKVLPYTAQRSSYVGPDYLRFGYSCRGLFTESQVTEIEEFVNNVISKHLPVYCIEMPLDQVLSFPNVVLLPGEEYPDMVRAVLVGREQDSIVPLVSVEPCCGTHVSNTSALGHFVIKSLKSDGSTAKTIHAVTGEEAKKVLQSGYEVTNSLQLLKAELQKLEECKASADEFMPLLKKVKKLLHRCNFATDLPLLTLMRCEQELKDMKSKLVSLTGVLEKVDKEREVMFKRNLSADVVKQVQENGIPTTNDCFKHHSSVKDGKLCIPPIESNVIALFHNDIPVAEVERGQQCLIVTDKTNFFAEGVTHGSDKGVICNKDFHFDVNSVYSASGYVFHEGCLRDGNLSINSDVLMKVDEDLRQNMLSNHTGSHLLYSALRKHLPCMPFLQISHANASQLHLQFKSKEPLSNDVLEQIENDINCSIRQNLPVCYKKVPLADVKEAVDAFFPEIEVNVDSVPVVSIGDERSVLTFTRLDCGLNVRNTSELESFTIISCKSMKNMEKSIKAVTEKSANIVSTNGKAYDEEMSALENLVAAGLETKPEDCLELWDLLRDLKTAKNRHETDLPLLMFRKHQDKMTEQMKTIINKTQNFIRKGFIEAKKEMEDVLEEHRDSKFIVHRMKALGDGKKIANLGASLVEDRPSFFFALDGHQTVVCTCCVPEECVTPSFTALLWIEPVATLLRGRSRFQSKDPELYYSIESNDVHKIDDAVKIAIEYIKCHL